MIILRELSNPYQIKMFIMDDQHGGEIAKHNKIERTLSEMRRLHDKLNRHLSASPVDRPTVQSPNDIYEVLRYFMTELDHEELWVVCLDTRNRVMSLNQIYKGSLNQSQVRVAELFKRAIIDNACSIIIAHNHPRAQLYGIAPHGTPNPLRRRNGVPCSGELDQGSITHQLHNPPIPIAHSRVHDVAQHPL